MNRRQFIASSAALTTGALLARHEMFASTALLKNVGIGLFSLPKVLEKDFAAGIRLLGDMGYREAELYGPYPFSAKAALDRWASITPQLGFSGSGFFGKSAKEVKAIFNENKIKIPSIHTDLETLRHNMSQLGEAGETLGFTYVVLPAIPPESRKTLDDYKKISVEFNKIGEEAKKAGLKFAYHNHGYGLHEMEGKVPLQLILENTDPKLVFLEMDLYWTVAGGADPITYLKKYKGRYVMMHVKNMKKLVRFSGDGSDPAQWIELFPYMATADDNVLDLKSILTAAQQSGVKHFFVEQDMVKDPEIALKKSIDYLKSL
jgi:sugar phosphate isomerase/epimerase